MLSPSSPARLVIVVGPTGVGKTKCALSIARKWGGEIISADSMQVYRYMDIGTAKLTPAEREGIPHHLLDIAEPQESFNASLYTLLARRAIAGIGKGKPIIVVGGTGLYIKTLLGGILAAPGPDAALRLYYQEQRERYGKGHLFRLLEQKDPLAACHLDPADTSRIIRALEVWEQSGRSIVEEQEAHRFGERPYICLKIGLTMEKDRLYERITSRTEEMIDRGLVGEVEWLLAQGYHGELKSMQAIGYRHIVRYLRGEAAWPDVLASMNRDTQRYAKRQLTWFKADKEILWFPHDEEAAILERVGRFLGGDGTAGNILT